MFKSNISSVFHRHPAFCLLQLWWWGDLQVGGATRLLQPWLSASCPPAAALQSNAGLSTKGVWPAPRALRRSVPPSFLACIAQGSRHLLTMAIITRPQMPMSRTTTKSTAKRRTSSKRRRKEVGLRLFISISVAVSGFVLIQRARLNWQWWMKSFFFFIPLALSPSFPAS